MKPKKYIVQELFGSLFSDDITVEAETKQKAIKEYLKIRDLENMRAVSDSIRNGVMDDSRMICVQEGWYSGDTKYIRGKRNFYKLIKK